MLPGNIGIINYNLDTSEAGRFLIVAQKQRHENICCVVLKTLDTSINILLSAAQKDHVYQLSCQLELGVCIILFITASCSIPQT